MSKGRQCRGSRIGTSKHTEETIKRVIIELSANKMIQAEIGRKYGVSSKTITLIKQGKQWKHRLVGGKVLWI